MKRYFIIISCVLVCAIFGIVFYCCVPKTNDLMVSADDISINVGQKVKLEYSTTIPNAALTFLVKDKEIAEVSVSGSDVFVTGVLEGETVLSVTARYKDARFEESVYVKVSKIENQDNSSNQDNPIDIDEGNEEVVVPPTNSDDIPNPDAPNDNNVDNGQEIEITFIESNFVNFSIQDEVITILKDKKAIFSVETNINGTIDIESLEITAAKLTNLGDKAFSLLATEVGEFEITIIVNGSYRKNYVVKVE